MPNLPSHNVRVQSRKSATAPRSQRFNPVQLSAMWIQAGGKPVDALIGAALAMAESGGRSDAVNHNTNGSTDTGLWQVNSVHGYNQSSLLDPRTNAQIAVKIKESEGWGAWTTYKSGAYKKFMGKGGGIGPATASGGPVDAVTGAAGAVADAVTAPFKWADELGTFLHTVQSEDFWKRILLFALGIAAMGFGLVLIGGQFADKSGLSDIAKKVPIPV